MTKIIHTGSVSSLDWFSTEDVIASSSITGDVLLHSVKTGTLI